MKRYSPILLTIAAAISLWIVQTQLATNDHLILRLLVNVVVIAAIMFGILYFKKSRLRTTAPDPSSLVLCGLVALGVWPAAWWLMDLTDHFIPDSIDAPRHSTQFSDPYALYVLFSVIVLPLALAGLLWGVVQPDLARRIGKRRAVWIMSLVSGACLALVTIQRVAPGMPYGLPSVGGYLLIGAATAWAVHFTDSFWAGFAAYGTFAYANFALEDDLFRALAGKDYLDPAWLTLIVLGLAGSLFVLQLMRFRLQPPQQRDQESEQAERS